MVWTGGHGLVYGMAWLANGIAWQVMAWFMVCPGVHGIVYGMADRHGMLYVLAWRAWHGIWYGLAGITWYILWPGGQGMIYGMA